MVAIAMLGDIFIAVKENSAKFSQTYGVGHAPT